MIKNEMISAIAEKTGYTKKDITSVVDSMFEVIGDTLAAGEDVKIVKFGTFAPYTKEATTVRNPKTGEKIDVPAKRVAKFKPSSNLKEKVNA